MNLKTEDLKNERQWRSATGYPEEKFTELLKLFTEAYKEVKGDTLENIKAKSPKESKINSCEDLLFLTLFSLKSGLTYDLLGVVTGMDTSTAMRNFELGIEVLKKALSDNGHAPKRAFLNVKEFREYFKKGNSLIIDGTEQLIQRPKEGQKDFYSGKKRAIRSKQR